MDDRRRAFTFLRSYYEAAKMLPDKHRLSLYDAILGYGFDDAAPKLTDLARTYWILIEPVMSKSKARAEAGAIGGLSRAPANAGQTGSGRPGKRPANPEQTRKQTPGQNASEEEDETVYERENPPGGPRFRSARANDRAMPEPALFEAFWNAYPRKAARAEAERAWTRLAPDGELAGRIVAAVAAHNRTPQWTRDGGQYIPYPAKWLDGRRFEDPAEASRMPDYPPYDSAQNPFAE